MVSLSGPIGLGWVLLISAFLVWYFRRDAKHVLLKEDPSKFKAEHDRGIKEAQKKDLQIRESQQNETKLIHEKMQFDLTVIAKDLKLKEADLTEEDLKEFLNAIVKISVESGSNVKESYFHYLPTIKKMLKEDMLFRLGQKYETGNGVLMNHSLALYYYHRAALDGSNKAFKRLGFAASEGANTYHLNKMADYWRAKSGLNAKDDVSLPDESTQTSSKSNRWVYKAGVLSNKVTGETYNGSQIKLINGGFEIYHGKSSWVNSYEIDFK